MSVTSCLLQHFSAKSPIAAYRSDMAADVQELVADGMAQEAAWLQVADAKLADLKAERTRIEQSVADAYAKTAAGKPAAPVVAAIPQAPKRTEARGKAKHPNTVMGSRVLALVSRSLGGLDPAWISQFSHRQETKSKDKNGFPRVQWRNPLIPGVGQLFRRGGTQDLQLIAETLEAAGYLVAGSVEADARDAGETAAQIIRDALNKEEAQTLDEQEAEREATDKADADAYYAEQDAQYAKQEADEREAIMTINRITSTNMDALLDGDVLFWDDETELPLDEAMFDLGFDEQEIADAAADDAERQAQRSFDEGAGDADQRAPALDGFGEDEAGPAGQAEGLTAAIDAANLQVLVSSKFAKQINGESVGGNAGPGAVGVNVAVDSDGRIKAIGNWQQFPADVQAAITSNELTIATLRVSMDLSGAEASKVLGANFQGAWDARAKTRVEALFGKFTTERPEVAILTAQTPEDLKAKAGREAAGEESERAKRAAEQTRLRKAAEARDDKARADRSVGDFQLGQSADQQMSGMGDLFAAPAAQDRRVDAARRKRVNEMSDAEMRAALLTDDLTGLNNGRWLRENQEAFSHIIAFDADSLKWVNDNMGHEAGDMLLKAWGAALQQATPNSARMGGDEFFALAAGDEEARAIAASVEKALSEAVITASTPDGDVTITGIGSSFGIAQDRKAADEALNKHKRDRETAGTRAGRGEQPPGATRSPAGGQQDQADQGGREDDPSGQAEAAATLSAAAAAGPATPLEADLSLWKRIAAGQASVEDFKAGLESWLDNKEAIIADLAKNKKDDLLEMGGGMFTYRYKSKNKQQIVDALWDDGLSDYTLGRGYSYGMSTGSREQAIRLVVENTDADQLAQYAADLKAGQEEAVARVSKMAEAIKDPKTLTDYQTWMRATMVDGMAFKDARLLLAPEQRAAYDDLAAEASRSSRKASTDADRSRVSTAGQSTSGEIIATKHTRLGHDLWVVKLADRVSREDYGTLLAGAKRLGGSYSSFRGAGAVPGFQFRAPDAAQAFLKLAGGDKTEAQAAAVERRDAFADDRSQSAAERLTEMADRLDERADESLGRDRKTNTSRRAGQAASAEAAASDGKAMAKTMRNLATAIGNGAAKFLDRVRQKAQVEMLQNILRTAQYAELQAKFPTYAEQERNRGAAPTIEAADFAEFPTFTAYRSDLASLARQLLEVDGTKLLGQRLMKVADDVSDAYLEFAKANFSTVATFSSKSGGIASFGTSAEAGQAVARSGYKGKAIAYQVKRGEHTVIMSPSEAMARGLWKGDGDKRITLDPGLGAEMVEKIGRAARRGAKVSVPWQLESAYDRRKALSRMGIETPAEMRAALREFIGLREQAVAPDKVKQLERAMIGRRNDGMDFFPTPEATADEMVAAADIQPGMRVLEPSAGWGHIAERIRSSDVEPDVVEMSGERRELLEAKGFNVIGSDFIDITEGGYDRILMNPPFSDGRDIQHVRHAFDLLKPGGRVVAIMGESAFTNQSKRAVEFRDWLESVGGTEEKLPDGTFLDSDLPVNTGANARMVVIDKAGVESDDAGNVAMFSRPDTYAWSNDLPAYAGQSPTDRVSRVQLAPIRLIESTEKPDPEKVKAMMLVISSGQSLPPITVEFDGEDADGNDTAAVIDGHHRLAAAKNLRLALVPVRTVIQEDDWPIAKKNGGLEMRGAEYADRGSRLSREAQAGPAITEPQARAAVATTFGDKTARALLDAGLIEFVTGRDFNGATYADGRIQINLDAVTQDTIGGVLKHEAFHSAVRDWLGPDAHDALMIRMGALRKMAARPGAMKTWFDEANAAIPADTRPEHMNDELAAYSIEQQAGAKQPGLIGKWVQDFLSALRTAIIRRMPDGKLRVWALMNVKPQDLARMAVQAMQAHGAAARNEAQGAMAYSRKNATDKRLTPQEFERGIAVVREVEALAEKHGAVYIRWSPASARDLKPGSVSRDFVTGSAHSGLSAVEVTSETHYTDIAHALAEYGFLRMQNRASVPRVYVGERVGTDSDSHALIRPSRVVLEIPADVVDLFDRGLDKAIRLQESIDDDRGRLARITDPGGRDITEAAIRANQIKLAALLNEQSAPDPGGAFDPANADIRYSRAAVKPDWVTSGSAALQGAAGKIDTYAPTKTIAEKAREMSAGWKGKLVQGMLDAYAPLKNLSMDAYIAARMTKAADGAFEGMLMYGKPMMTADGGITGNLDGKGFLGTMRELNGEHDRFFMWLAGNRAELLLKEGRENLFTADEIAAMKALSTGAMADGNLRAAAYGAALSEFSAYNKSVLDVAEKAGLIDGESRKLWEHDFYVPFYRMSQENEISGPVKIKGLARQKAFEKLKGGKENLGDLMDNTLRNWSHLLSASLANVAASKSLLAAERTGIAIEAKEAVAKEMAKTMGIKGNATYFMDQGMQRWFIVEDSAVLQAVSALEAPALNGLPLQIMAKFKKYLTIGVTIAPAFKIRNLIRDTLAAPAANEMSFNIAKNLTQGWKGTNTKTDGYAQMLFGGGVMRFGTYLDGDRAENVKRLIASGIDDATILNTPQKVKAMLGKAWDAWQDFGDRLENVNRTALYQQLLDKGMSPREAAFQARDMMDFSLQGSWAAMRTLTAVVPFLNARAQGLYKLGRAAAENPKRMGYMIAAVSLASIALMLANEDDDDWKAREDWDRDAYWWIKIGGIAYRIPKPFEVGAMGTIAERSVELVMNDEMTGRRFSERMKQMVTGTFAINPVPQLFKPMLDLYANKDSFTGRQIETLGMERMSKPERYGPNTSGLAKAMGAAGEYTGISPVQVDHMIRAYFGWLGTMGVATIDAATSPFSDAIKPEKKIDDYFGGFVKELPAESSRYVEDFYKQAKITSEAMADLRRAREAGDTEKAAEILESRGDKIALSRLYQRAQKQISDINQRSRMVRDSPSMDADTKRQRLNDMAGLRNRIAKMVSIQTRDREAAMQ